MVALLPTKFHGPDAWCACVRTPDDRASQHGPFWNDSEQAKTMTTANCRRGNKEAKKAVVVLVPPAAPATAAVTRAPPRLRVR